MNARELAFNEPILVDNLVKVYKKGLKNFFAVDQLSFGVATSECFGLLGLNGAGKTTTINILTGQQEATDGRAYLNGLDVSRHRLEAISHLGFCPQFVIITTILAALKPSNKNMLIKGLFA